MTRAAPAGGSDHHPIEDDGRIVPLADRRTGIPETDAYIDLIQGRKLKAIPPSGSTVAPTVAAAIEAGRTALDTLKAATPTPRTSGMNLAVAYWNFALNCAEGKIIGEDQRRYRRLLEHALAGRLRLSPDAKDRLRENVDKAVAGDHEARRKLDDYLSRDAVERVMRDD